MQVATAVIAVVVDLSQPGEALKSAVTWLQLVKSKLQSSYDWLEQKGSKLPEQLRLRARKYIGSSHEDREAIQHLGQCHLVPATALKACLVLYRLCQWHTQCGNAPWVCVQFLSLLSKRPGHCSPLT